jgi:hypothetical protein
MPAEQLGNAAFLTPIGHKNNTIILGLGGYIALAPIGELVCPWKPLSSALRSPLLSSPGLSDEPKIDVQHPELPLFCGESRIVQVNLRTFIHLATYR